jgi:hypothetical protein
VSLTRRCGTEMTNPLVALHDGRLVDPMGQDWQIECLAQWLLGKPLEERRQFLANWERSRKSAVVKQLRDVMTSLHRQRRQRDDRGCEQP